VLTQSSLNATADAWQAERALRQKLEIQHDGLKHQNGVLKEELRDKVQKLEEKLAEASSLLEHEQIAHRRAEEKAEELRASVRHLSLKSDGLEDKSQDIHHRWKVRVCVCARVYVRVCACMCSCVRLCRGER